MMVAHIECSRKSMASPMSFDSWSGRCPAEGGGGQVDSTRPLPHPR